MNVAIVTVQNGFGLSKDAALLQKLLSSSGMVVQIIDIRQDMNYSADINIFLEVIDSAFFERARKQAIIPNPEWWRSDWSSLLSRCRVFAKTRHAESIFSSMKADVVYTGFLCDVANDYSQPKDRSFLLFSGQSRGRFAQRAINLWRDHPNWPLLRVTGTYLRSRRMPPNIEVIGGWLDPELCCSIQDQAQFHLCLSRYEGFGHVMWEALSLGGIVVALDAPPMNETISSHVGCLVPSKVSRRRMGLVALADLDPRDLCRAVESCLALKSDELARRSIEARALAYRNNEVASQRIVSEVVRLQTEL